MSQQVHILLLHHKAQIVTFNKPSFFIQFHDKNLSCQIQNFFVFCLFLDVFKPQNDLASVFHRFTLIKLRELVLSGFADSVTFVLDWDLLGNFGVV